MTTAAMSRSVTAFEPRAEIRWSGRHGVLREIDLPALVRWAVEVDGVIELTVTPGDLVRENAVVATVRGGHGDVDASALLMSLEVGLERTFDQDPRFAFRLLADIAIRALSAAINDQATAVQVIDTIDALLSTLCERRLDVGRIRAEDHQLQVLIPVPTWDDYVDAALADIVESGGRVTAVSQRLLRLLDDIGATAHPSRRPALERWRCRLLELRESDR